MQAHRMYYHLIYLEIKVIHCCLASWHCTKKWKISLNYGLLHNYKHKLRSSIIRNVFVMSKQTFKDNCILLLYLICSMFIVSSIIWSLGKKGGCWRIHGVDILKPCKRMCWTQTDYNNLRTMFALKVETLKATTI